MTRLLRYLGLSVQQFVATVIVFGMAVGGVAASSMAHKRVMGGESAASSYLGGAEWFEGSGVPNQYQAPVERISGRTLCPSLTLPTTAFLAAAYSGDSFFVNTDLLLERAKEIRNIIKTARREGIDMAAFENSWLAHMDNGLSILLAITGPDLENFTAQEIDDLFPAIVSGVANARTTCLGQAT
jgi:hypothetical protein